MPFISDRPALTRRVFTVLLVAWPMSAVAQEQGDSDALAPITVRGQRVANLQPASTYSSLATALRYDPSVRLQPRGLAEGQADVTVRGGLFENTGFRLGAVTVIDPQTGHYAVEFPFDPAMLSAPEVLTDTDNALLGFNAAVATVQYRIEPVRAGVGISAGAGSDDLLFGTARAAAETALDSGRRLSGGVWAASSRGDGTVAFGDHDFERYATQFSIEGPESSTHLMAGYHDKFFGWPGAYTGFANLPETDRTRLTLLLADHRRDHAGGWWEVAAAWRKLKDDYDFDRRTQESGAPGSFDHETRAAMVGLTGEQRAGGLDWRFNAQFTADRLAYSTDLVGGDFTSRNYMTVSLAPVFRGTWQGGREWTVTPGLRGDWSNRDQDAVSPFLGLALEWPGATGDTRLALDYARTTQLPGYTALKSPPSGLFGGNPDLGREEADTVTLSLAHQQGAAEWRAAVFQRRDRDLVDWTFRQGAPFARQANPVDIDVWGVEAGLRWGTDTAWLQAGYAWLDKDEDYGAATVDASYYALNFARHRGTLALAWRPVNALELRLDNEYRVAEDNPLRSTGRRSFRSSLAAAWRPGFAPGAEVVLAADNLTDDDFQEFPGTPAAGRQWSLALHYDWQ